MPDTMHAVILTGHGGLDRLEYRNDWPKPTAAAGEALVHVLACGLNNTDINTRTGWYSKSVTTATDSETDTAGEAADAGWGGSSISLPRIQGADVCGIVEAVGSGAPEQLVGQRVLIDTWLRDWDDPYNRDKTGYFGSERDGGYADYTTIDARNVHPIDSSLTDAELATFATAYGTAEGMLNRAAVSAEDTVLITGASGGVGSALIQLAQRRGARTVALCGSEKVAVLRELLNPTAVLPRTTSASDMPQALRAAGIDTVTVVADVVGGESFAPLIELLCRGGRYVTSGGIAGPIVPLDLRTLYLNDLSFYGSTVLPPGVFADLVSYISRGEIKPLLAQTYPLEQVREAQQAFAQKQFIGKIVLQVNKNN